MMKRLLLVLAMLLTTIAGACYNDRDTLGFELRNKPDVLRALTGRFDRFPPLYYQMRIDRLRKLGHLSPSQYDDLAVALDRLGKSDEALKAIEAKSALAGLSIDDRYRLFANRGTIHAHHWLRSGAKPADLAELRQAEADIAEAMRLNPNAHFGREGVQLELIRWLLNGTAHLGNNPPLSKWLASRLPEVDISRSLAGLITLGGAWESADVALAIAGLSQRQGNYSTLSYALCRFDELRERGKPLFFPSQESEAEDLNVFAEERGSRESILASYEFLRGEAEIWEQKKTAFVESRLKEGRHPDTDPQFWSGWAEPPLPKLPAENPSTGWLKNLAPFVLGVAALLAIRLVVNRAKRRLEAAQPTY